MVSYMDTGVFVKNMAVKTCVVYTQCAGHPYIRKFKFDCLLLRT